MISDQKMKCKMIRESEDRMKFVIEEHNNLVKELYPEGSVVAYVKPGRTPQTATVKRHGYGDVLFVVNAETGRVIKVTSYHILQAQKL